MKRLLSATTLTAVFAGALALSGFVSTFTGTYSLGSDAAVVKARCAACHASKGGGKLNAYGKELQAAMQKHSTKKLSAEVLHSVDALDSDKDGMKNVDEIKGNRLPGAAD